MDRRHFIITTTAGLGSLLAAPLAFAAGFTQGQLVVPFTPQFKPGEYVWHPEVSPPGPVVIIVSLPEQLLYVYRNGVRIGRSSPTSPDERNADIAGRIEIAAQARGSMQRQEHAISRLKVVAALTKCGGRSLAGSCVCWHGRFVYIFMS